MPYPLSARLTDDELAEVRAAWAAASGTRWRTEDCGKHTKLYALNLPNTHDWHLMDLSDFDANGAANVKAIAAAPEHIERLLSAYETLRDHVDDVQRSWEQALIEVATAERERALAEFEALAVRMELPIHGEGEYYNGLETACQTAAEEIRGLIAKLRAAVTP